MSERRSFTVAETVNHAIQLFASGYNEKAQELLSEVSVLGNQFYNEGNYPMAEGIFLELLRAYDNNSLILYNLGIIYSRQNKWDQAMRSLKKSIEINPTINAAYGELSKAFLHLNRLNDAVAICEQAIAHHAVEPEIYKLLGDLYSKQNKLQEALVAYQKLFTSRAVCTELI